MRVQLLEAATRYEARKYVVIARKVHADLAVARGIWPQRRRS